MKKSMKFLSLVFSMAMISLFMACGGEDDTPDIDDIIDDVPAVADGIYIIGSASSEDPSDSVKMAPGYVGSGELREGFYEAYIYLGSGSFNFVFYAEEEPTSYGGTYESLPLQDNADLTHGMGDLAADGAAITPPSEGLYHVHLDQSTNLFFLTKVEYFEIIGSATEDAWNSGQELALKSASANEVVFEGTNIILRTGEYKFRYNSNWDTNQTGNPDLPEGLNLHSNIGLDGVAGSASNFPFTGDDGAYTVTVTYTPGIGSSMEWSLERTGDAPEITFDPAEYQLGVIGSGTAGYWDTDRDLVYKGLDATKGHRWAGVVYLLADSVFKFRANDAWDFNLGGSLGLGAEATLQRDAGDIPVPGASGAYYVEVYTADEGATWKAIINESGWGLTGSATPNGWADDDATNDPTGVDHNMNADGFVDGITTYSLSIDLTSGENLAYKFRANDAWDLNLGGDMAALSFDGSDLTVSETGTYEVVLSFDGSTYSAVATKQ